MHPSLGIVIPSFDRPQAIRRAVSSVVRQRDIAEVIVVDDASRQPVDLSGLPDHVRLLRHGFNRGVCAARNTGTMAARSTHLIYLDDDDTLLPWAGWFFHRWIAQAPDCIVAGAVWVDRPGQRPQLRQPPSSRAGEIWGLDAHLSTRKRSINTKQAAAIPRGLIERVGGWDENLRSRSSSEMFYRLTAAADARGHRVPVYRLNRGPHDKLTLDPAQRRESHAHIRKKHANLLSDPARGTAFEAAHDAMMVKTGTVGPRRAQS